MEYILLIETDRHFVAITSEFVCLLPAFHRLPVTANCEVIDLPSNHANP
jgi:hypothetical protein